MPKSRNKTVKKAADKQARKAVIVAIQNEQLTRARVDRLEAVLAEALEKLIAQGILPPFEVPAESADNNPETIRFVSPVEDAVGAGSSVGDVEDAIPCGPVS